jgi:hypothetical protein
MESNKHSDCLSDNTIIHVGRVGRLQTNSFFELKLWGKKPPARYNRLQDQQEADRTHPPQHYLVKRKKEIREGKEKKTKLK